MTYEPHPSRGSRLDVGMQRAIERAVVTDHQIIVVASTQQEAAGEYRLACLELNERCIPFEARKSGLCRIVFSNSRGAVQITPVDQLNPRLLAVVIDGYEQLDGFTMAREHLLFLESRLRRRQGDTEAMRALQEDLRAHVVKSRDPFLSSIRALKGEPVFRIGSHEVSDAFDNLMYKDLDLSEPAPSWASRSSSPLTREMFEEGIKEMLDPEGQPGPVCERCGFAICYCLA